MFTTTLTYSNYSAGTLSGLQLSVPVPAGASFVAADGGGMLGADGVVRWAPVPLAAGVTDMVHLTLQAAAITPATAGLVVVDATLNDASNDLVTEANGALTVYPAPALLLRVDRDVEPGGSGQAAVFTWTVTNLTNATQTSAYCYVVPQFTSFGGDSAGTRVCSNNFSVPAGGSTPFIFDFTVLNGLSTPPNGGLVNLTVIDADNAASVSNNVGVALPPTPTPIATPTPTITATPTATATTTATPTPTSTPAPPTPTPTPAPAPSSTPAPAQSPMPTPAPAQTPTAIPVPTQIPTPTLMPTTPTPTPTPMVYGCAPSSPTIESLAFAHAAKPKSKPPTIKAFKFPKQALGSSSAPLQGTLTNSTTKPLTITKVSRQRRFRPEQRLYGTATCPGASCYVSIVFTPKHAGTRTGTLTITTNGPKVSAGLSGVGAGSQGALDQHQVAG